MPREIVRRATDILAQLEKESRELGSLESGGGESGVRSGEPGVRNDGPSVSGLQTPVSRLQAPAPQLSIFETVDPTAGKIKAALEEVNINNMTPIECMMKLQEMLGLLE